MSPPVAAAAGIRRRTHPVTPVLSGVREAGILIAFLLLVANDAVLGAVREAGGVAGLLVLVAAVLVVAALIIGANALVWSRTEYFFDAAGNFGLDSGVIGRKERRLALSRLQSVDVVRPLLGRLVGMAQVRIEVAGGEESRVVLSYLSEAKAQALRAEILARAAGLAPETVEAPETVLVSVPTRDLILSLALLSETIGLLLISAIVVSVSVATAGLSGLGTLLVTGGLPAIAVFTQFMRYFGFTLAESPDGLRLRHGLASVASQTVPPGRVQALEVFQPLLWRRRQWVRINLNVAGPPAKDGGEAEFVLLPVAPVEVAREIILRFVPGADLFSLPLEPAPAAARRRAWFQWRNLGAGANDQVFVARRGWLTTRVAIIPHARTQSVGIDQGAWQRRLGLASVRVDTTPGPVKVDALHRDVDEAVRMAREQLRRATLARAGDRPMRWLRQGAAGSLERPPSEEAGPA